MKCLPCDQIAFDILEAQRSVRYDTNVECTLSISMVTHMVEKAEHLRKLSVEFGDPVSYVLELHGPFMPPEEYECYKRALGTILKRRSDFKKRMKKHAEHGRYAPFAP